MACERKILSVEHHRKAQVRRALGWSRVHTLIPETTTLEHGPQCSAIRVAYVVPVAHQLMDDTVAGARCSQYVHCEA